MSGIAGVVCFDKRPVDNLQIAKMAESIAHRGSNGVNVLQFEGVSLVHCLLQTTPESLFEFQPLKDNESEIVIIADARIDNRRELLEKFRVESKKWSQIPDCRIILEAYKKWGSDCPGQLVGDFAFALWDPHIRKLFCARDHIGARPFYYYYSEKFFVFSSEIKAILTFPHIPQTIDDSRVADYLQLLVGNNTNTFYKNIFRLEPATALTIDKRKFIEKKYWDYNHGHTIKRKDDDAYAQEFKEIFFEAVRCRLRSTGPIGCTMSGGLDSSSVACVAEQLLAAQNPLHTFSFNFPRLPEKELKKIDECQYQNAVLAKGSFVQHAINGHEFEPLRDLTTQLKSYDQPFFFPHLYLEWQALKIAQGKGIRVMLNGLDGDTVVSHGYEHVRNLLLKGRLYGAIKNLLAISKRQHIPKKVLFKTYLFDQFLKAPLRYCYHFSQKRINPYWNVSRILTDNFALTSGLTEQIKPEFSMLQTARRYHYRRLTNPLLTHALEQTNNFSLCFQIENRSPFFDRRLMEYCYSLPPEQKLKNGWTRYVLRQAMKGIVPVEVIERTGKSDLTPGFISTFWSENAQGIEGRMADFHPYLYGKIDRDEIRNQFISFREGQYTCNQRYLLNLYNFLVLERWLENISPKKIKRGMEVAKK